MTDTQQTNAALIAEARAELHELEGVLNHTYALKLITALEVTEAKVAALEEANGILEDALQEVGTTHTTVNAKRKVQPLMEGYLRKGGLNPPTTQTFVRPPPPAPMRAAQPQPTPPTKKP